MKLEIDITIIIRKNNNNKHVYIVPILYSAMRFSVTYTKKCSEKKSEPTTHKAFLSACVMQVRQCVA